MSEALSLISIISYVSRDIIVKKNKPIEEKIGGSAYYAGLALATLGRNSALFIHTDNNSCELIEPLENKYITIYNFKKSNNKTPTYYNIFQDDSCDKRLFKADLDNFHYDYDLLSKQMRDSLANSAVIHLAPTRYCELRDEFLLKLKMNKVKISCELQFIVKSVDLDGKQIPVNIEKIKSRLKYFDVVNLSIEDISYLGESSDIKSSLLKISKLGPQEVILTMGSSGAMIYEAEENKYHDIAPVKPKKIVDPVGCGDTFIAAYLHSRSNNESILSAGNFAAKIASRKIETTGAYTYPINGSD